MWTSPKKVKKHEGHRKASKIIDKYLLPLTCQVEGCVNRYEISQRQMKMRSTRVPLKTTNNNKHQPQLKALKAKRSNFN